MINIVVCDDSQDFSEIISAKIELCMQKNFKMEYSIVSFTDIESFNDFIKSEKVDVVFLDIMLGDKNAMDWSIENIKSRYIQLIFMTAFPQCAYNISESNCCYYLQKSKITEESLFKALQKALQNTSKKNPNLTIVKSDKQNIVINFQDIMYLETYRNSVNIYLSDKRKVTVYSTLKDYYKQLPPSFLRCHKGYIVNMNFIHSFSPFKFTLRFGTEIPIPAKKYGEIIEAYQNYITNF